MRPPPSADADERSAATSSEAAPLLPAVARGERGAAAACVERYGPMLWGMARRWLRASGDAEDAVQDIFVELWRVADRYDPSKGSESVFVATLGRRRMIDRLRKAGRRPREVEMDAETMVVGGSRAEHRVEANRALALLAEFPEERRKVLTLVVVHGWTHAEVSAHTGIALGTVKSHVRRGLSTLRDAMRAGAAGGAGGGARAGDPTGTSVRTSASKVVTANSSSDLAGRSPTQGEEGRR